MERSQIVFGILILFGFQAHAFDAVYSTPLKDGFANSNPTKVEITRNQRGEPQLNYSLPEDLVGPAAPSLSMAFHSRIATPSGSVVKFTDHRGWSVCVPQATGMTCTSEYKGLSYDEEALERLLNQKYSSLPDLLQEKQRTSHAFFSDPIGVLTVTCPVAGCGI